MEAHGNISFQSLFLEGKLWFYCSEIIMHANSQYLVLLVSWYICASFWAFLTILTLLFLICFGIVPWLCVFLFVVFFWSVYGIDIGLSTELVKKKYIILYNGPKIDRHSFEGKEDLRNWRNNTYIAHCLKVLEICSAVSQYMLDSIGP